MSIGEIYAVGIIAALSVMLLREARMPHPELVVLVFGVLVIGRAVIGLGEAVALVEDISATAGVSPYVKIMLKAAGIAYVSDLASGICKDSGSGTAAEYVGIAAKTEILILSIPVVRELTELSLGMLS